MLMRCDESIPFSKDELESFMKRALELAHQAGQEDEVPVGALIVRHGEVIAEAHNRKEGEACATRHAELIAIEEASRKLGAWRLSECYLFVTLEPCLMCSGAIVGSRLDGVIYGTPDPKGGAAESLYQTLTDERLNHQTAIATNVLQSECSQILKDFFRKKRG